MTSSTIGISLILEFAEIDFCGLKLGGEEASNSFLALFCRAVSGVIRLTIVVPPFTGQTVEPQLIRSSFDCLQNCYFDH